MLPALSETWKLQFLLDWVGMCPFLVSVTLMWIDSPGESQLIWIHLYSYGLFRLLCASLTTVLMHAVLMSAGNSVLVEANIICQKSYQRQIRTKMKHFTTSSFTAVNQPALPEQLTWCCLTWAASQTGPVYLKWYLCPSCTFCVRCGVGGRGVSRRPARGPRGLQQEAPPVGSHLSGLRADKARGSWLGSPLIHSSRLWIRRWPVPSRRPADLGELP